MKLFLTLLCIALSAHIIAGIECNGPHEYVYENTPVCPLECSNLHELRCLGNTAEPSCQCKDGTVRDSKAGKCVKLNECPKQNTKPPVYYDNIPLVCNGENEKYSEYVSACPSTCEHPEASVCDGLVRRPSCVCSMGTIRDTVNGKCVKREDCPKNLDKLVCDGDNEEYSDLTAACPYTCHNRHLQLCPMVFDKPSCICKKGTIRDTFSGKCVDPIHCPVIE